MASTRRNNLIDANDSSVLFLIKDDHEKEDSRDSSFNTQQTQRRKHFMKKFRKEWMDEPIFAGWLQPIPDVVDKCYCAACRVVLYAGHSELEKHAAGKKHCIALESFLADNCIDHNQVTFDTLKNNMDHSLRDSLLGDAVYDLGAVNDNIIQLSKNDKIQNNVQKVQKLASQTYISNASTVNQTSKLKADLKRKQPGTQTQVSSMLNLPARPDAAKLIRLIKNEPDDDDLFYNDEEEEDCFEALASSSEQLLREMRAELAFSEKELIQQKQKERMSQNDDPTINGKIPSLDDAFQQIAEKELEARLNLVEERRRQQLNIYKLQLLEMESRVKLAESAVQRETELHNLRITHLHLQIQKEQATIIIPEVQDSEHQQ